MLLTPRLSAKAMERIRIRCSKTSRFAVSPCSVNAVSVAIPQLYNSIQVVLSWVYLSSP